MSFVSFFKLNIDAQWIYKLSNYLTNICADEDLYCQETSPLTRNELKCKRLLKILKIILYKSEVFFSFFF